MRRCRWRSQRGSGTVSKNEAMSATVQFTKSLAFNLTLHKLFIAVWSDISSRFRGRAVPVRTRRGRPFSEAKRAAQESARRPSCSAKAGIRLPFVWESGGRHAPNATAALLGNYIMRHSRTWLDGLARATQGLSNCTTTRSDGEWKRCRWCSTVDTEASAQSRAFATEDLREGAAAFREKRRPRFLGA